MQEINRINEFLDEAGVFFLASVDGNQAKCRPLGFHMEKYGRLYFAVGEHKDVFDQISKNPGIEIVAINADKTWLRYSGDAVFEIDPIYANLALDCSPKLKEIYNDETGNTLGVFHLEYAKAVLNKANGETEVLFDDTCDKGDDRSPTFIELSARREIEKRFEEARKILSNKEEFERTLQSLEHKSKRIPMVGNKMSQVFVMISLLKSYYDKDYRDIPFGTIVSITAALIYYLSPIDILPDSIPLVGLSDDAAVIGICWKMVQDDIKDYQKWREQNGKKIDFSADDNKDGVMDDEGDFSGINVE